MGFFDRFLKKKDEVFKQMETKYSELSDKAEKAKIEDSLANKFNEDVFVQKVLNKEIEFKSMEKKPIKTLLDNYELAVWQSVFGYFELQIMYKNGSQYVDFKINHVSQREWNVYRLNNAIRHGKDSTTPEQGLLLKLF